MIWLAVIFVAVLVSTLMVMNEVPISVPVKDQDAFDPGYSIVELDVPALSGPLLQLFVFVLANTPLKSFYVRKMLNVNGIWRIRQLVAELSVKHGPLVPTHFPIHRLSNKEHEYHVQKAKELNEATLTNDEDRIVVQGSPRTINDYQRVYQSGKATPTQVIDRLLTGCAKLEHLKMFRSFDADDIRRQARASTERWKRGETLSLFDGVPVAFKDMLDVQGHRTCSGSQFCTPVSQKDDELVARFRNGGAIILGLTVMTEGGVTPLGYSLWSDGPFNPYDTAYYSGGSSSGSAVVVAAGLAPVAIGFDGGGSIRVPASMCGVVGLASTFGRVQTKYVTVSMVKAGPITSTVHDAALSHVFMNDEPSKSHVFSRMYDGGNKGSPPPHLDSYREPAKGLRLGVFWEHFHHSDPEVVAHARKALRYLEDSGAEVVNITIPYLREMHLAHATKILSEFAVEWDAHFYNTTVALEPNTVVTLLMGKALSANEVLAAEKLRTWALDWVRMRIFSEMKVDAIVSATLGTKVPKPKPGYRQTGESNTPLVYKVMRFIPLANLLGLPALSLPIGYEKKTGLPIGFQVMGNAWSEHVILRVAAVLEQGFSKRRFPPPSNYFDPLEPWM